MQGLYNILLTLLLIFSAPYFLLRSLAQKRFRKEFLQRIGFFPDRFAIRPVWVHASSVGEVFCSIPLVKRIRREFPQCEIVLTTMTRTGNEAAKTHIAEASQVLFFPVDHPFTLGRLINKMQPIAVLIAETELWPNFLRCCGKRGIPIILFNGRISQKSFRGYLRFRSLFRNCLSHISLFLMQTEEDRIRIMKIGAPPDRTKVLGNLKFDQPFPSSAREKIVETAKSLGLQEEPVLIAGSTHSGEEEILVRLFKELRENGRRLVLILAPRHLERLGELERILEKESFSWVKRTTLSAEDQPHQKFHPPPDIVLLDTMGELINLYSLGTLVFVGGSLVPVGGHNPLEPLFFKKCVLFGPQMFNFSEISRSLVEAGGAVQVKDKEDLLFHLRRLLSDEEARNAVGERGYQFLLRHRGTTERTLEEIRPFLKEIGTSESWKDERSNPK